METVSPRSARVHAAVRATAVPSEWERSLGTDTEGGKAEPPTVLLLHPHPPHPSTPTGNAPEKQDEQISSRFPSRKLDPERSAQRQKTHHLHISVCHSSQQLLHLSVKHRGVRHQSSLLPPKFSSSLVLGAAPTYMDAFSEIKFD